MRRRVSKRRNVKSGVTRPQTCTNGRRISSPRPRSLAPRSRQGGAAWRARSPACPDDVSSWMRVSEAVDLRCDEVDVDRKPAMGAAPEEWSLGGTAHPRRRVACDPALSGDASGCAALAVHLRARAAADPPVGELPARDRCRARRLPPVWPHMLRHSCGFYLANRGYDLRLIQDYLGHRDPKHTVHYTRPPLAGSKDSGDERAVRT